MVPISFWSAGPLLGWLISLFTDFGSEVKIGLFEVCALIQPLFGLAVFVELILVLGQLVSTEGATKANRKTTRAVVRANAGLLVISEGLAMYAVGADRVSTVLVVAVVVPMLIQVFLLMDCAYLRVGINRIQRG